MLIIFHWKTILVVIKIFFLKKCFITTILSKLILLPFICSKVKRKKKSAPEALSFFGWDFYAFKLISAILKIYFSFCNNLLFSKFVYFNKICTFCYMYFLLNHLIMQCFNLSMSVTYYHHWFVFFRLKIIVPAFLSFSQFHKCFWKSNNNVCNDFVVCNALLVFL